MIVYQCPVCSKCIEVATRSDAPFRPFCSQRCKFIDLGRWLNEEYRIEIEDSHQERESAERDVQARCNDDRQE